MWNCHSWLLDISRHVKLPFLTMRCQKQCEIAIPDHVMSVAVWNCQSWELDVTTRGYIWQPIWVLHLTFHLCHFIWQVLGGYIWQPIWVLHLTCHLCHFIWQVPGGISESLSGYLSHIWSWSLHLTSSGAYIWALHLKTWPNSAICFKWALIDNIDQQRTLLLALAVSYQGVYLRTLSDNLNLFRVWLLLHRGLFYERPINTN